MNKITSYANANIALIKYWGKRDEALFLPTKSSLSISLDQLQTETSIEFADSDIVLFNNLQNQSKDIENVIKFLNFFRKTFGIKKYFKINTFNNFPTSAGLASSASGFAALTKSLNMICGLNLTEKELSILARQGSGSACRSIYEGFVLWNKGGMADGSDSFAEKLFDRSYWLDFVVLVCVVNDQKKEISSRVAMQNTLKTSKFYWQWIDESEARISVMIEAIKNRDFTTVGRLAQQDCLDMHKAIRDSIPSINYLSQSTYKVLEFIKNLNQNGLETYFTIDAGPNVKILCKKGDLIAIKEKIKQLFEVLFVL